MLEQEYNLITYKIIRFAIEVHKILGPGLIESIYEVCLYEKIQDYGVTVERQKLLPVNYKGNSLNKEFVIDQLVDNEIIVELKSVENILSVHEAQLLTSFELSKKNSAY